MPTASQARLGAALTVSAAFLFAGKTVLAKLAYREGMDPLSLLCIRLILAGAVFAGVLAFNTLRGKWRPQDLPPSRLALAAVLGVGGYYLCSYLDFAGLYYIDASLGRMILFLYPTLVVLLDAALTRTAPSGRTFAALGASYLGLLLMMAPHVSAPGPGYLKGCALVFLSALIYSFYLMGVDRGFGKERMPLLISVTMMVSVASVLVHYALARGFPELLGFSRRAYVLVVLISLFSTVAPIYAMSAGIALIGASKAAMYNMAGPLMTLAMGWALLGERLGPPELLGTALIILGVSRVGGGKGGGKGGSGKGEDGNGSGAEPAAGAEGAAGARGA
jgi:drug/metabolite transporter (DMT)-like permease